MSSKLEMPNVPGFKNMACFTVVTLSYPGAIGIETVKGAKEFARRYLPSMNEGKGVDLNRLSTVLHRYSGPQYFYKVVVTAADAESQQPALIPGKRGLDSETPTVWPRIMDWNKGQNMVQQQQHRGKGHAWGNLTTAQGGEVAKLNTRLRMLEDHALSIEVDHRAMDTLMARTDTLVSTG